jgi:HAD superfamily hydrolase (TIGR01509 family)
MTRPAAVLFDCDGVITDSEGLSLRLISGALGRHGLAVTVAQMEADWLGATVEMIATRARGMGAPLPQGWVADVYAELYAALAKGTPLIPGILSVFDALDAAGIPYAVGSNGTPEKMQITLGQNGLLPRFRGHVYSGQALGRPKPAPDLWLQAAQALGVAPTNCVVIEDSAVGAEAARRAGIRCFGFAPHGNGAGLAAEGAVIFRRMEDLPGLLGVV